MAYVPGFENDLFLSYAQADSEEWVRALEETIGREVIARLGNVQLWQDKKNIRFGQDWPAAIEGAVGSSAAFLAIISPNYRQSAWCDIERNTFIERCESTAEIKAGTYYRFLKLVKAPWPGNTHEQFYPDHQHINFFDSRPTDELIVESVELAAHTEAFRLRAIQVAQAIACLLEQMRRSREAVFIAGTTRDCAQARGELWRELKAYGYDARPDGNPDRGYSDLYLKQELDRALLSIHVLGGVHDRFVEKQIDVALEMGKPLLLG